MFWVNLNYLFFLFYNLVTSSALKFHSTSEINASTTLGKRFKLCYIADLSSPNYNTNQAFNISLKRLAAGSITYCRESKKHILCICGTEVRFAMFPNNANARRDLGQMLSCYSECFDSTRAAFCALKIWSCDFQFAGLSSNVIKPTQAHFLRGTK